MLISEFSDFFDIYFNNITNNQAPGLNEHEKSVFLTRAEKEVVLNHISRQSAGNTLKEGFDDSAKRQADFSVLMKTENCSLYTGTTIAKIDDRSSLYTFPTDVFIPVNETIVTTTDRVLQVLPLRYDEYTKYMSKPYKRPLKNQAWRLMNSGSVSADNAPNPGTATKYVEIITNSWDSIKGYIIRYVRTPKPIILANLAADGLSIDGQSAQSSECELDPILHEEVLHRAVELAKIHWTQTGQDNMQAVMQAGQRSE